MILCSFRDQELKELHYGFVTEDFNTVTCACCGGEFEVGEDAKILEIYRWINMEQFLIDNVGPALKDEDELLNKV